MRSPGNAAKYDSIVADLVDSVRAHDRALGKADSEAVEAYVTAGILHEMKPLAIISRHDAPDDEERQLERRLVADALQQLRIDTVSKEATSNQQPGSFSATTSPVLDTGPSVGPTTAATPSCASPPQRKER